MNERMRFDPAAATRAGNLDAAGLLVAIASMGADDNPASLLNGALGEIIGLAVETTHLEMVTPVGWWLLVYSTVVQFCIAYVSWFAALARLPASVAAIGTMAVPVIGVVASAIALGTWLGGWRIIRMLGKGVVDIAPVQGMAAQSSAAAS